MFIIVYNNNNNNKNNNNDSIWIKGKQSLVWNNCD